VRRGDGKVLAFERSDFRGAWQLPQGGIENGETAKQAAWRELEEETGLGRDDVRMVGEYDGWTVYQWPKAMRRNERLGQVHRWFFFEPLHDTITPHPDGKEFCDWKWMSVPSLIKRVVDFRREPYRQVLGG
jgi:putative (di)nucleoside polyphosphate hydrolase